MIYKNVKLYQVTYQNINKIRELIRNNHGITINKSQVMEMAVNHMIKLLVTKNNLKEDDRK